jgi:hypothetical protein
MKAAKSAFTIIALLILVGPGMHRAWADDSSQPVSQGAFTGDVIGKCALQGGALRGPDILSNGSIHYECHFAVNDYDKSWGCDWSPETSFYACQRH